MKCVPICAWVGCQETVTSAVFPSLMFGLLLRAPDGRGVTSFRSTPRMVIGSLKVRVMETRALGVVYWISCGSRGGVLRIVGGAFLVEVGVVTMNKSSAVTC